MLCFLCLCKITRIIQKPKMKWNQTKHTMAMWTKKTSLLRLLLPSSSSSSSTFPTKQRSKTTTIAKAKEAKPSEDGIYNNIIISSIRIHLLTYQTKIPNTYRTRYTCIYRTVDVHAVGGGAYCCCCWVLVGILLIHLGALDFRSYNIHQPYVEYCLLRHLYTLRWYNSGFDVRIENLTKKFEAKCLEQKKKAHKKKLRKNNKSNYNSTNRNNQWIMLDL